MTQFLGYRNYGEEYKMMGLAPYGKPKYFKKIIENLFKQESSNLVALNLEYFNHWKPGYRYIADDSLEIDQIFNDKLNNLFEKEKSENEEDFSRILHAGFKKFMSTFSTKLLIIYF